jgi:hypothetical protein
MQNHLVNLVSTLHRTMVTNTIYIVLRCQRYLRTAQQKQTGGRYKKPLFNWAEKIPQNHSFVQPEDAGSTYEEVALEAVDGSQWKTKLVHSTFCEEDVRISGHSYIKHVALQHRAEEARKHIDELQEAGVRVVGAPKSLWEDVEPNDNMLDSTYYVVHEPTTLDDGTKSILTRYWWDVAAVVLGD